MSLKVWGPLIFTILLFVIATGIKFFGFAAKDIWLTVAPELSLWATGVLFSLSVARSTFLSAKATPTFTQNPGSSSVTISYAVQLPSKIESSEKYLYSFMFTMTLWVLTVLLSGYCVKTVGTSTAWTTEVWVWNTVGLMLSGISIGIAMWFLFKEEM